jgi:outer membrane receptor protein involved in Fe transport
MKVSLLGLMIFCLSFIYVKAQEPQSQPKGNGKISGIILDSANREPVPFATVALLNPQTQKPIDGAVCDEKGKFLLKNVAAGTYDLSFSFIGYKNFLKKGVVVSERGEVIIGIVSLSAQAQELSEITVEGQKELIEEKVDRTVYNAELDATTKGGDATDVLRRVPMLSVDLDGNVSLRGNQNISVLINNKPSTITAGSIADALKQIPADQIKSVEVITSPSAKYDAEGSGGIINIITKKNTIKGFTLDTRMSGGLRGSDLGLNGSLRTGKMGFSLGGHGRVMYNMPGSFENSQQTTNNDASVSLNTQTADTRQRGLFGRYTLSWDYDIDKKNSLSASVQYGARNGNNFQDNLLTQSFQNNSLISSSLRNVDVKDLSGTVDVSLTYSRLLKKPQQELNILALYSLNNRTNDFINNILDVDTEAVLSRLKNLNKSYNQEYTFQADYQTPISTNQMFEVGAKNITRNVVSDFQYFFADGANGPFVPSQNTRFSNVFNYDQYITAGYFSYTLTTAKKWSFKFGSRYEYTTIQAKFQDGNQVKIPAYGVLVPSLNISKRLNNSNTIKFAYNRRIQRPSIQFLNPNIQAANPLNVTIGNPALDPEFTNNFELGYSTFFKGTSLNVSAFARNTNNAIQSVIDVIGRDTIQTSFQNIGSENAYGLNIFANINLGKKFTLNGGGDVFYADLKNNVPNPLYNASNQGLVYSFRFFGGYNMKKGWGLQFFSFYRGRQILLQGEQGNFRIYSLSLRKDFNDKRGSVGFGFDNFFGRGINIRSNLNSPIIKQEGNRFVTNLGFRVNFNYRLGKMSYDGAPRRKKSINNDDLKEGGENGGNNMGGGDGPQQGRPQNSGPQNRPQPNKNDKPKTDKPQIEKPKTEKPKSDN